MFKKKVLLRERKRHTARRVASTHYAVPVGGTSPLSWDLTWTVGYLLPRPGWGRRVPHPRSGYGGRGTPFPGLDGGYPLPRSGWRDTPFLGQGTPPSRPGRGTPPPLGRMGYPPVGGMGVPPPQLVEMWTGTQSENTTFPHPSDAGGNNIPIQYENNFSVENIK